MSRSLLWPITLLAVLVLLHVAEPILVPLLLAGFLAQLLLPVVRRIERVLPRGLAITLGLTLVGIVFAGVIGLVSDQLASFQKDVPALQERLTGLVEGMQTYALEHFGMEPAKQISMIKSGLESAVGAGGHYAMSLVGAVVAALGTSFIVALFAFLMLYSRSHFHRSIVAFFGRESGSEGAAMIERLSEVAQKYVAGLMAVIGVVGVLDTVGCLLVKAPFPVLFGLLGGLSVLIPYVGFFVVAPTCSLLTLAATGSTSSALAVFGVFAFVHFIEGNVITPAFVGHQVNLNPLASLLAILIGGELWGPAGMLLFIPVVGMVGLLLDMTPKGKPLAQLIGSVAEDPRDDRSKKASWLSLWNRRGAGKTGR